MCSWSLSLGHVRNIYFPFDVVSDTPMNVANEMVKELEITDREPLEIAEMIAQEISILVPDWKERTSGGNELHHAYNYVDDAEDGCNHPFYDIASPTSSQGSVFGTGQREGGWFQGANNNYRFLITWDFDGPELINYSRLNCPRWILTQVVCSLMMTTWAPLPHASILAWITVRAMSKKAKWASTRAITRWKKMPHWRRSSRRSAEYYQSPPQGQLVLQREVQQIAGGWRGTARWSTCEVSYFIGISWSIWRRGCLRLSAPWNRLGFRTHWVARARQLHPLREEESTGSKRRKGLHKQEVDFLRSSSSWCQSVTLLRKGKNTVVCSWEVFLVLVIYQFLKASEFGCLSSLGGVGQLLLWVMSEWKVKVNFLTLSYLIPNLLVVDSHRIHVIFIRQYNYLSIIYDEIRMKPRLIVGDSESPPLRYMKSNNIKLPLIFDMIMRQDVYIWLLPVLQQHKNEQVQDPKKLQNFLQEETNKQINSVCILFFSSILC